MKTLITVNGNDLRTMVKAALSVTANKATVSMAEDVLIKVHNNKIYVCANRLDSAYRACTSCSDGDFEITIHNTTAKKILNIKGNSITFIYDSENDRKIKMTDGKKSMELACFTPSDNEFNFDSYTCELEKDRSTVFTVDAEELLDGIKTVAPFRYMMDHKPILKGFNFNGETGHLETIDGYRAIRKSWRTLDQQSDYNFTVQEQLENIKNVFDKSGKISVAVTTDNKMTVFAKNCCGITVEYVVRNYEGDFHPVAKVIPNSFTTVIKVDNAELTDVIKEYKGYVNTKASTPMYIGIKNGDLYTAFFANDVKVSDRIAAKIDGDTDFIAAYKTSFILDSLKALGKNEVTIRCNDTLTPIIITNGEYECINLPVRIAPEDKERFMDMIA